MKFCRKISGLLKSPGVKTVCAVYIFSAVFITAAIISAVNSNDGFLGVIAYVFYALAVLSLVLIAYVTARVLPRMKQAAKNKLKQNKYIARYLDVYDTRTMVTAVLSFVIGLAYSVFNAAVGIATASYWLGTLAAYYFLLTFSRGFLIIADRKAKIHCENISQRQIKAYMFCGAILAIMPLCLSFAIARLVTGQNTFKFGGYTIYAAAAYAFYKIIAAVAHTAKARRGGNYITSAARHIALADSTVSILALQTAMFAEFSPEADVAMANALTGFAVCAVTLAQGLFMLINGAKKYKRMEKKDTNVGQ